MSNSGHPITSKSPLHEAVTCILSCVLQGHNRMLKKTIDKMQKLQVIEEYPLVLSEIIDAHDEPKDERLLAAVCLKNYLDGYLNQQYKNSALFTKGYGNTILQLLFQNINNQSPVIRETIATNIALLLTIGFWDEGTIVLSNMLESQDPIQICNAAHILNKAIDEQYIKNDDRPMFLPWFGRLLDVLKMTHLPSVGRAFTIRPLYILIKFLSPNPNILQECLAKAVEEFEKVLHERYSPRSEFALKYEIMKFLNNSLNEFSEFSNIFIPPIMPAVGMMLTMCCDLFKKIVRGSDPPPKDSTEEQTDPKNFFDLVGSMLTMIYNLIDLPYLDLVLEDLFKLIYCVYVLMSCHSSMEDDLYTLDTQKNFYWSLRDACKLILLHVAEKIKDRQPDGIMRYFKTTDLVFQRLNQELEQSHGDTGSPTAVYKILYMSRLTESMVYGLGSVKEYMNLTDPQFPFPLSHYLNYWTGLLDHCNPMLQGRIIWAGGLFCNLPALTANAADCHFKQIIGSISGVSGYLVVPSTEALCQYYQHWYELGEEKKNMIGQYAQPIFEALMHVSKKICKFELVHTLRALGFLIKCHRNLAKLNIDEISELFIKILIPYSTSPAVIAAINFACGKIGQADGFKEPPEKDKFLRFLQYWVHNLKPEELRDELGVAFELLNTVFLYAPITDQAFILQIFSAAATRITMNKDRDLALDESAGALLTTIVTKLCPQFRVLVDTLKGQVVAVQIPKLLDLLLSPDVDFPSHVLAKLVITILYNLPDLMLTHYEGILRNLVTCSAKPDCKKIKANWEIFIFICMNYTNESLTILSNLPGPHGGSALAFMLKLWKPDYFLSVGIVDRKILAFCLMGVLDNCLVNHPEARRTLEEVFAFEYPSVRHPATKSINGLQHLIFILINSMLCEHQMHKQGERRISYSEFEFDYSDFGENPEVVKKEEDLYLFRVHQFNIDVLAQVSQFFRANTDCYMGVVTYFFPESTWEILKEIGCPIPEPEEEITEDMYVQEAME
ncbi:importin-9 [Euwallacea similis]|uniref:importin-9 n=1 Tax=Euwallacea similis TaxID=1736056 RepID=UPI003450B4AE